MKTRTNFTANAGPILLQEIQQPNHQHGNWTGTVLLSGAFGAGTMALFLSPDKGTTLIPLTSTPGGTAISFTAAGMVLINSGFPNRNFDTLGLYGTLSGATAPNLNVDVYDNVG